MGAGHAHPLYLPGTSPLHRCPPQCKIAATPAVRPRRRGHPARGLLGLRAVRRGPGRGGRGRPGAARPSWPGAWSSSCRSCCSRCSCPSSARANGSRCSACRCPSSGLWGAWNIVAKGTLGVAASAIVAATTPVAELLRGLERLRLPKAAHHDRRVHGPLRRRDRRRGQADADRPHLPRPRPPLDLAGQGGGGLGRALFIRSYERGERVYLAMVSRGYAGAMPVLEDLARDPGPVAGRPLPAGRGRPGRRHRLGGPPMTPALEVEGVAFAYPDGHQALFGVELRHPAGRAGGPARAQRGRQDHAGAPPQRDPPAGRRAGRGRPGCRWPPSTSRRSGAGSGSSSRTPTTSCSCRRWPTTWPSGRPTSACAGPSSRPRVKAALAAVGMEDARRPAAPPPVVRAAAPGGGGHRAGHGAGHPGARRALVQPRPGQPPRAGRDRAPASTSPC